MELDWWEESQSLARLRREDWCFRRGVEVETSLRILGLVVLIVLNMVGTYKRVSCTELEEMLLVLTGFADQRACH